MSAKHLMQVGLLMHLQQMNWKDLSLMTRLPSQTLMALLLAQRRRTLKWQRGTLLSILTRAGKA